VTEPTQEQIKEFWEWCGFTEKGTAFVWPDLFEYAVPLVIEKIREKYDNCRIGFAWNLLFSWWLRNLVNDGFKDPALALFWELYEVMKNG